MENKKSFYILHHRSNFLKIKKDGKRLQPNSWLVLNYLKNDLGYMRFGWTVPSTVGGAVTRNKLKRWCRESVRNLRPDGSYDVNFIFRPRAKDFYKTVEFVEFKNDVKKALELLKKRE